MQSLFSVFKRPSQGTDGSQRRKSSSVASAADSTPRHLAAPPSTLQKQAPPEAATSAPLFPAEPPKARSVSAKGLPPPPPRSRQVSATTVPTLAHPQPQEMSDNAQYQPLYIAVYLPQSDTDEQPSAHRLALHLARSADEQMVRKYQLKRVVALEPSDEQEPEPASAISPTTVITNGKLAERRANEAEEVEAQNEPDFLARGLVGYVAQTDVARFEDVLQELDVPSALQSTLSSTSTTAKDDPSQAWLMRALSALYTHNLLLPFSTPSTSIPSTTVPPTQTQSKLSQPPSQPHRDTGNWNDLPEDFLTADAPRAAGAASHRRKLRDRSIGTPIVTPRATPRVSPIGSPRVSIDTKSRPPQSGGSTGLDGGIGALGKDEPRSGHSMLDAATKPAADSGAASVTEKSEWRKEDKGLNDMLDTVSRWLNKLQEKSGSELNSTDENGVLKVKTADLLRGAVDGAQQ